MHGNGLLDVDIVVIRSRFIPFELLVQIIEVHLDLSSSGHFECPLLVGRHFSVSIVPSRNVVFVSLDEFGDHVPEDLRLLCVFRRHSWTQIFKVFVGFLHLLSDLLHNLWQVMLDVSK